MSHWAAVELKDGDRLIGINCRSINAFPSFVGHPEDLLAYIDDHSRPYFLEFNCMDPSARLVHGQRVESVEADGAYMPPSARRWTETNKLPQGANNENGRERYRERGRSGCGTRKASEAATWLTRVSIGLGL